MAVYLETERLILRQLAATDANHLFDLDSDPAVMRHITDGEPTPLAAVQNEILPRLLRYYEAGGPFGFWAAIEKASGEFLGWFHFRPFAENPEEIELGYRLKRSAWGKGCATEGSRALVRKGFEELGVRRVVAKTMAANAASRRVMEKVGLKFEKSFTDFKFPGADKAAVKYALDKANYRPANEHL